MGRGRAKAKQTKVARALKYAGPDTDLQRLQQELASNGVTDDTADDEEVDEDDDVDTESDPYAKYYDDEDEDTAHSA